MTIIKKTLGDLKELTVVPQCLDNQWLPAEDEKLVNAQHGFHHLGPQRNQAIRREFLGALLTSEQLIINRAFAINNHVLGRMYVDKKEREALRKAIETEDIIFFLSEERSLDDEPDYHIVQTQKTQLEELRELCKDISTSCLRFDWKDEAVNSATAENQLSRRFHEYFIGLASSCDTEVLSRDFNISHDKIDAFGDRIKELSEFAYQSGKRMKPGKANFTTRTAIYQNFVSPERNHTEGFVDPEKPFARQIKKLVDLKYNCTLPDALGKYAVTAAGDIDRSVLQELSQFEKLGVFTTTDEVALIELMSMNAFDELTAYQAYDFLHELTVGDIAVLKQMNSWKDYSAVVKKILPPQNENKPFDQHAVFDKAIRNQLNTTHGQLLFEAAKVVETRHEIEEVAGWWEIGISILNTTVKFAARRILGQEFEIPDEIPAAFAQSTAPILIELTFGTLSNAGSRKAVRKYPLLKGKLQDANVMCRNTIEQLKKIQARQSSIKLVPGTAVTSRTHDRRNTLNLPE